MWYRLTALIALACLAGMAGPVTAQAQDGSPNVVMVLDASNSMWGQVEGEHKIVIARQVVAELLGDWDPGVELGLVAYGHRREGDCSDIETVIPVGTVDPQAFSGQVDSLLPRGRTPLTAAVRHAAELLRYTDEPATVILLSDGIETCNADPCALGEELERAGVNFTAHVIGFDVAAPEDQAQLRCLADNTGGVFLTAETAEELSQAMDTVREATVEPITDATITLQALDGPDGEAYSDGVTWQVTTEAGAPVFDAADTGAAEVVLEAGRYVAGAERGDAFGSTVFEVTAGDPATHQVVLTMPLPEATLDAPPEAPAGSGIPVAWTGPDDDGDYITVVPADADAGAYLEYSYTRDGSPLEVLAPEEPGEYELRYIWDDSREIIASRPIIVTEVLATLEAPAEVVAGADVRVDWTGPDNDRDFITIVEAGADEGEFGNHTYTYEGSPLDVLAPDEPGAYEIRYLTAQTRATLASIPLTVMEAVATLEAPPEVVAGAEVRVDWTGPDNDRDFITIVEAGADEGEFGNHTYTYEGSPLDVLAPDEPGAYEIRYSTAQTRSTLASLPLTVTEAGATLEAPPEVVAGADVRVDWTGPDNERDFITIVEAGADEGEFGNYTYTREGSPLDVPAPDEAGDYEIRYLTAQTRATLASIPLTVAEAGATLEAPSEVEAGADVRIDWTGPDNERDFITIVEAGADEGEFGNYTYTREGSPLDVPAPDEAGDYEIRYLTAQTRATLVSVPLTVTEAGATLEAPQEVVAGADVRIDWTGPDNERDFITIVEAGADEGEFGNYTYTREGSPLDVPAPDEAGDYEIRYLTAQTRATLVSLPLTVTAAGATLEAPQEVVAGAEVRIDWTGPDNERDFITIVEADADEGEFGNYTYTREGSPLEVLAPEEAGAFEIRYLTAQTRATLTSLPLTVTEATGTLDAPQEAVAGADISVVWTGPDNDRDFITVVEAGADEGEFAAYTYTREGSPLEVRVPDEPGAYEVRYLTAQTRATLVSLPITVIPATATLQAPEVVVAGELFDVTWEGPDNQGDVITLVEVGADEGSVLSGYTITRGGNPARVRAPNDPGNYELRYVTGQSRATLASIPIRVE